MRNHCLYKFLVSFDICDKDRKLLTTSQKRGWNFGNGSMTRGFMENDGSGQGIRMDGGEGNSVKDSILSQPRTFEQH